MRIKSETIGNNLIELFSDEREEYDFVVCLNKEPVICTGKVEAINYFEGMRDALRLTTDSEE